MNQWPTTHDKLLASLCDEQQQAAWFEFSEIYEPVIYRFARKRGLQHEDAAELTQQVMLKILSFSRRWAEEERPLHFRSWLKTVARNTLINMVTREARYRAAGGSGLHGEVELVADPDEATTWTEEEHRSVLRLAAKNIRTEFSESSWAAFEMTLYQRQSVEVAAAKIGTSKGAVYASRARIIRRLKQETAMILERTEES